MKPKSIAFGLLLAGAGFGAGFLLAHGGWKPNQPSAAGLPRDGSAPAAGQPLPAIKAKPSRAGGAADKSGKGMTLAEIESALAGLKSLSRDKLWERMNETGGKQPPEFASTHPSHETRIQRLRALLPKAMAEYERAARPSPGQ